MTNTTTATVLTLDVGSGGVRVQLFGADGTAVEGMVVQQAHAFDTTPDGGAVLDARQVASTCDALLDAIVPRLAGHRVVAVATTTLVSNILGLNLRDQPITPLYTWADTRSHADLEALRAVLAPDGYHDRTGCILHTSYVPSKLRWLQRTAPEVFAQVQRWVSLGEYLFLRWFGEPGCSLSVASWNGLLNRHTRDWDDETLRVIPLHRDQLGTLADVGAGRTDPRPEYAARWPGLRNVPFLPAIGDGVGSNIGSGCTTASDVALVVGTSGAMRVLLEGMPPSVPTGLWAYFADGRRTLLGGALSNGGNVWDWLSRTLRLPPPAELEQALAVLPPAAHGLAVLPFLAGERAPGWSDDATATWTGLRLNSEPIHLFQAALEAVAYRFALIHQRLAPHLPPDHTIRASGGGLLRSPAWTQIIADVLGRPVVSSEQRAATGRGTALLALDLLDLVPLAAQHTERGKLFQPDPTRYSRYQEALQEHVALYNTLINTSRS